MAEINYNTRLQKANAAIQNNFARLGISNRISVSKNTITVFGDMPTTKHQLFIVFSIAGILIFLLVVYFTQRLTIVEEAMVASMSAFSLTTGFLLIVSIGQTVLTINLHDFSITSENTRAMSHYFNIKNVIGFKEITKVALVHYIGITAANSYRITATRNDGKETILLQLDYRSLENALIAQQIKKLLTVALWEFKKGN